VLVIDNPLKDPDSVFKEVIFVVDSIFTVLFTIEALIKIIAMGFMFNNLKNVSPYMRNAWNLLDIMVVVASLIDFGVSLNGGQSQGGTLKSLKALRALRALRPLRMISRNEGLRLVVNALLSSIPAMTNVILVCCLFLIIFAIMGINFFKGSFYSCELPEDSSVSLDSIYTKEDCLEN